MPVSHVTHAVLVKVVEFMNYHFENPAPEIEKPLRSSNMTDVCCSFHFILFFAYIFVYFLFLFSTFCFCFCFNLFILFYFFCFNFFVFDFFSFRGSKNDSLQTIKKIDTKKTIVFYVAFFFVC